MRRAWKVSSGTAIAAAIEVSLNSEMKVLAERRQRVAEHERQADQQRDLAAASARSRARRRSSPAGTPSRLARKHLGQVGAGIERQRDDEALHLAHADAEIAAGRNRRSARSPGAACCGSPSRRPRPARAGRVRSPVAGEGAGQPDHARRSRSTTSARPRPSARPPSSLSQIGPDHAEIERVVHSPAPAGRAYRDARSGKPIFGGGGASPNHFSNDALVGRRTRRPLIASRSAMLTKFSQSGSPFFTAQE